MIADLVADLLLEVLVYPVRRAVERAGDWALGRAGRLLGRTTPDDDSGGRESAERDGCAGRGDRRGPVDPDDR